MKNIGILLVAGSVALLVGCGSRSDDTTAANAGTTGQAQYNAQGQLISGTDLGAAVATALNVRVISDRNNIPTGGSDVATITALITNEKNQAVANQVVDVSSTGGVLQGISAETDENGEAKATLALAQDFQNQNIEVTVSAGEYSGTVLVTANGSKLNVAGPDALVSGDNAEMTVTLSAGNANPVANREVAFTSLAGNTITPTSAFTDADGRVTAVVTNSDQDDTITVTALDGSATTTYSFKVAADILAFDTSNKNAEFTVGDAHDVTATWIAAGQPVVGQELRFAITAGQLVSASTVTTNASGSATIQVVSSSAGPATVSVEAANGGDPATQIDVEFVATTASKVAVDSSSSRVHTEDNATVTALVTDLNGNPVKNKEVVFTSSDLKGGQLNPASALTNSAGEASVTFTAGDQATKADEIELVAEVLGTSINAQTNLTVVKRVLNVTIGSSNVLELDDFQTQYRVAYVVQVADGGGAPLADANVELSIEPVEYRKGRLVVVDINGQPNDGTSTWQPEGWSWFNGDGTDYASDSIGKKRTYTTCPGEDLDGNRVLDAGEDTNNNGSLDPQDPALLAPIEASTGTTIATLEAGNLSTDNAGSGYFNLVYPTSNALWSTVRITARAQALGAEAVDSFLTELPMLAESVQKYRVDPPNRLSPYGTTIVAYQDAAGNVVTPCQTTN